MECCRTFCWLMRYSLRSSEFELVKFLIWIDMDRLACLDQLDSLAVCQATVKPTAQSTLLIRALLINQAFSDVGSTNLFDGNQIELKNTTRIALIRIYIDNLTGAF